METCVIGLRLSSPVRASKLSPIPPPLSLHPRRFLFYRSLKVVYREAGRDESRPAQCFSRTIWGCSVPRCFLFFSPKQSPPIPHLQPFSQSPIDISVVPWHSARCLFLLFPLHHLKTTFYLPTRSFPPTRSPSINPNDATEPLDLPIPSTVLERPAFQGKLIATIK